MRLEFDKADPTEMHSDKIPIDVGGDISKREKDGSTSSQLGQKVRLVEASKHNNSYMSKCRRLPSNSARTNDSPKP